jgi:hypothetical protein
MPYLMFVLVVLSGAVGSTRDAHPQRPSLCIWREEDGGRMNLVPVRIFGRQRARERRFVELVGSSHECVEVSAGRWSLEARSFEPYDDTNVDPNACRSKRLRVDVGTTGSISIEVSPRSEGSTYVCGWSLRRR